MVHKQMSGCFQTKLCKKPSAHWLQFPTLVPKDGSGEKLKNSFFSKSYKPHLVMGLLSLKEDNFGPVPQRSRMLAILG